MIAFTQRIRYINLKNPGQMEPKELIEKLNLLPGILAEDEDEAGVSIDVTTNINYAVTPRKKDYPEYDCTIFFKEGEAACIVPGTSELPSEKFFQWVDETFGGKNKRRRMNAYELYEAIEKLTKSYASN